MRQIELWCSEQTTVPSAIAIPISAFWNEMGNQMHFRERMDEWESPLQDYHEHIHHHIINIFNEHHRYDDHGNDHYR
jgi:Lhr-like helicase